MHSDTNESWFQRLWNRKVPQYLGTYFAVGFGLLQFLQYLSERFDLGKAVELKFLVVWLTLVPAITILIYFADQLNPRTDSGLAKWPKFLVGGNIILALVLAVFISGEKEAESEVVSLTDEEGETIKAVVPALKKVKTLASFQFENGTGDPEQDWLGVALSFLLEAALEQRPEFYVKSQFELDQQYDKLDVPSFTLPNVGVQREIAQNSRNDYFTRLTYTKEDESFVVRGDLFSAKSGEALFSLEAKEADFYLAVDGLKEQISKNIPNPLNFDEDQISLPSSSLVTPEVTSLKYLTEGIIDLINDPNGNVDKVIKKMQSSIDIDTSCALCYSQLGVALFTKGRRDEGISMIKKAVKLASSLPQRMQFSFKDALYGITDNTNAYIKLQELKRKMFPYDFQPYELLATQYRINYGIDSAKVLIQEAIDNGNVERGLLKLYDLQVENEEYLEAEKTLDKYTSEFPDREQDRKRYADIYEKQGKIEKAKEVLLEEELMRPFDNVIQRRLASLDFRDQNIDDAFKRIEKGLKQSENLTDSLGYLRTRGYFLRMCGRVKKAFETRAEYDKNSLKKLPMVTVISNSIIQKGLLYHATNKSEEVDGLLAELSQYSPETTLIYKCIIQENALMAYSEIEINSEDFLPCGDFRKKYGEGYVNYFNLMNAYRLGEFEKCLSILQEDKDDTLKKLFVGGDYFIADIYFKNNDIETAKKILQKSIDQKTDDPQFYYRMALVLENENKQEARKYLDVAMKYWANADDDFVLLKNAKTLSDRLLVLDKNAG